MMAKIKYKKKTLTVSFQCHVEAPYYLIATCVLQSANIEVERDDLLIFTFWDSN